MRRTLVAATVSLAAVLALPACGSDSLSQSSAPGATSATTAQKVDPALQAKLPAKIRDAKKITIGTDATYAPNEFLDGDGKTVIGMDVDLFNAVMAKFGVTTEWQPSPFDAIIAGVDAKKFDAGVSSLTINAKREEQGKLVSYFNAGNRWAVAKGNPKKFSTTDFCGKTIAVQTGTYQEQEVLPPMQAKCAADKKMNLLSFQSQAEATASLASGKADAMIADSPVVDYAVKQSAGKLETASDVFDSAPYGFLVPKDQPEFAAAIADALKQLKADGTYDSILKKWGVEAGAISSYEVNPKVG